MVKRKTTGGLWAAAVMGVLMTASLAGTAGARALSPADQPTPSPSASPSASAPVGATVWWGADHPGADDPSDPYHNDWHCDRSGNWHNDVSDQYGHPDGRCQMW